MCYIQASWTIYGFTLSYSSDFPPECPNYEIGNNLMHIILQFFCLYNLILIPMSLFAMYSVFNANVTPILTTAEEFTMTYKSSGQNAQTSKSMGFDDDGTDT